MMPAAGARAVAMTRTFSYVLALTTVASGVGCGDLRAREIGVCGNGIVEPEAGEDCDSSEGCVAPDQAAACLLECEDGACAAGFACGLDGVCRAQGDAFERGPIVSDDAWFVSIDELDADGRAELAFVEGLPEGGQTNSLAILGFDAQRSAETPLRAGRSGVPVLFDSDDPNRTGLAYLTRFGWGAPNDGQGFQGVEGVVIGDVVDGERFVPRPVGGRARERAPKVSHVYSLRDYQVEREHVVVPGVVYGGNLWIVKDDADQGVFPERVPALGSTTDPGQLGWAQPLALHPDRDLGGEYSLDVAVVEGTTANQIHYAGPVGLYNVDEGLASNERGKLDLPPGEAGFLPWVQFAQVDGQGRPDLLAATGRFIGNPDPDWRNFAVTVHVAYGVEDGSFHSDPVDLPDANGNLTFSATPQFEFEGTLDEFTEVPAHFNQAGGMTVADVNFDDVPDLLAERVLILSGDCAGQCSCGPQHECFNTDWTDGGTGTGRVQVADVSGDGWPEVLVPETNGGEDGTLSTYRLADGAFQPSRTFFEDPVRDVVVADLDTDGQSDTIVRTGDLAEGSDSIWVCPGQHGEDCFELALEAPMAGSMAVTRSDVFAVEDLLVAFEPGAPGDPSSLARLSGVGDQVVTAPLRPPNEGGPPWTHAWVINAHGGDALWIAVVVLSGETDPETDPDQMWFFELRNTSAGVLDVSTVVSFVPFPPPGGLIGVQAQAIDYDDDGVGELVMFVPENHRTYPDDLELGCTRAYVLDFNSEGNGGPEEISDCFDFHVAPRAGINTEENYGRLSTLDVDQDGDLDMIASADLDKGDGARVPLIWEKDDGRVEPRILTADDGMLDELRDWAAWMGQDADGNPQLNGVFATSTGLVGGTVDLDTREVAITWQEPWGEGEAPAADGDEGGGAVSIDTGDLDGDALIDFVVTTAKGPIVFWGTRTPNPT
jgi:hypothetical protein